MKANHMKSQTISLMITAMHNYIKRLGENPALYASEALRLKLRAAESSFSQLSEVAQDLNSRSLRLDFKKAA